MPKSTPVVLVFGAHPDDPEHMAGGAAALAVRDGGKVVWCLATRGDKGHVSPEVKDLRAVGEIRLGEARLAAKVLGVSEVVSLEGEDGFLNERELVLVVLDVIRRVRPTVIVTHSTNDHHPDHQNLARAVLRCCNRHGEPVPVGNPRWPSSVEPYVGIRRLYTASAREELYGANTLFVDISPVIASKVSALLAHESQYADAEQFEDRIRQSAKDTGRACGSEYAEAFCLVAGYDRRVFPGLPP